LPKHEGRVRQRAKDGHRPGNDRRSLDGNGDFSRLAGVSRSSSFDRARGLQVAGSLAGSRRRAEPVLAWHGVQEAFRVRAKKGTKRKAVVTPEVYNVIVGMSECGA
jgi:hypothetical protein